MIDVVADVDHRGHLGAHLPGVRADADQKAGSADASGKHHDAHATILP